MLFPIPPASFSLARPLFDSYDDHLAPLAVLAGTAGWGQVWSDDPSRPRAALLRSGRRFYLAGDPGLPGFAEALTRLFRDEIFPTDRAAGEEVCLLFYDHPDWEPVLNEQVFTGVRTLHAPRRTYEFSAFPHDWRSLLRPGDEVRRIDASFLADPPPGDIDHLREELGSECPAVEFFLEHRFGFALLREGQLAGWCLSEYNHGDRCEIGIETQEPYQRQGVATITAGALVSHAISQGIHRIGWDCWTRNIPSVAAARRAGFELVKEYDVFLVWVEAA